MLAGNYILNTKGPLVCPGQIFFFFSVPIVGAPILLFLHPIEYSTMYSLHRQLTCTSEYIARTECVADMLCVYPQIKTISVRLHACIDN